MIGGTQIMIRNDFDITDEEFNKIVKPFDDLIDEYIYGNFLYDFVAFYIAKGYQLNAMWESSLSAHVNSAIETLSCIDVDKKFDYKKLKKILEKEYSLIITNDTPLTIENKS